MERAKKAGVTGFFLPAINSSYIPRMLEMEEKYPNCFLMMGLHPCYVKEDAKKELENVANWLKQRKFSAIGEVGLDRYWDKTFYEMQVEAFRQQIELALEYQLPVVIHSRDAMRECIDVVRDYKAQGLTGIFHCFTGSVEEAKEIIDMGFYLGIGGVLTYKNSGLDKTLSQLSVENIVLETDAPYLSPVPYRGKTNESSYLPLIAEKAAAVLQLPVEELCRITTNNAQKVFKQELLP